MSPQYPKAHKARREQHNLSAILPFSFRIPEAVMLNLRVHPQFQSRYKDLGDLSNPGGWPRRVNVYERIRSQSTAGAIGSGTRSMPIHYNALQGTPYMMHRGYLTIAGIESLPLITTNC